MAQLGEYIGNDKTVIEMKTKTHEIRSTVKNVSKLPIGTDVTGPDFHLIPESMCCISLRKEKLSMYIHIRNNSDAVIKIRRMLVVYDCNFKKLHQESEGKSFSLGKDENDVIGAMKCCNFDNLINDTLIIDLSLNILEITTKEITNRNIYDAESGRKLREDFKTMLENPINSDVSVQVVDQSIPAHWAVLCSRSPYFKKMFDSGMQESLQNSVIIDDLSYRTVRVLIHFLYTAEVFIEEDDDLQDLFALYYAADKYEVMNLRNFCARKIMNIVTTDNVWEILQLAHRHNDKNLKMETMRFIRLHSDAAFQTEGCKRFKASEPLAMEFCDFFCLKKN